MDRGAPSVNKVATRTELSANPCDAIALVRNAIEASLANGQLTKLVTNENLMSVT